MIQLSEPERQTVCRILREVSAAHRCADVLQAWVFGSRSTGHARPYSDPDILVT